MALSSSIPRHFVGIEFHQPQATIADVVGFVDPVADLDSSDQEVAGDHKSKVPLHGRLEDPAEDGSVVNTGYRGGDIQFGIGFIEELDSDSGERSGSCILQHLKEREIEQDLSIAEHPRLSREGWLTGRRRSEDGLPQTLWRRAFVSPRYVNEETA